MKQSNYKKAALKQVSIETFRLALLRHGLLEEHFNSTSPTRVLGHGEAAVKRRKQRMKIIQIPAEASETKADAAIVSPRKPGTRIPKHTDEEILAVLKATGNDKRQAAKRLKISLATIYNRLGQIRLKMAKLSGSPVHLTAAQLFKDTHPFLNAILRGILAAFWVTPAHEVGHYMGAKMRGQKPRITVFGILFRGEIETSAGLRAFW